MQSYRVQAHLWRLGVAVVMAVLLFVLFLVLSSSIKPGTLPPLVEGVVPAAPVAEARIFTRIISPEIVPAVQLIETGVQVRGRIQCTAGQTLELRVRVTQGGNAAEATATYPCTGHPQLWVIDVPAGGTPFGPGPATVHVWSKTVEDGDTHEWERSARVVGRKER